MDRIIIYDIFDKTIKAEEALNKDVSHYREIIKRLKPAIVGADGIYFFENIVLS